MKLSSFYYASHSISCLILFFGTIICGGFCPTVGLYLMLSLLLSVPILAITFILEFCAIVKSKPNVSLSFSSFTSLLLYLYLTLTLFQKLVPDMMVYIILLVICLFLNFIAFIITVYYDCKKYY